jgi:methionine aminopeptidase
MHARDHSTYSYVYIYIYYIRTCTYRSAQFEHEVLITEHGHEVLTLP